MLPCQMAWTLLGKNPGLKVAANFPLAATVTCREKEVPAVGLYKSIVTIVPARAGSRIPFTSIVGTEFPGRLDVPATVSVLGRTVCAFRSTPPATYHEGCTDP